MRRDPRTAELRALQTILWFGLNPFDTGVDAGVRDAVCGRLYRESLVDRQRAAAYEIGWRVGRFHRLGC